MSQAEFVGSFADALMTRCRLKPAQGFERRKFFEFKFVGHQLARPHVEETSAAAPTGK
jgi:hypothetical protein